MERHNLKPDLVTRIPALPSQSEYSTEFPIVDRTTGYNEFFENYLLKNQPCLIKNIGQKWGAYRDWLDSSKTHLNYKYLYTNYEKEEVPVYDLKAKHFNTHKSQTVPFSEYLMYWESFIKSNYSNDYPLLYLKDWHLKNNQPEDIFYIVPKYFQSDWLNEYLVENNKDDYRFVYMGPEGTWTPLHADVFLSYSWSVNVLGKKRWILIPPGEENKLRDKFGNLPHEVDFNIKFKHFDVIQEIGDAIFVPSGWHHQVWNLKDTVSINHNWINGCNIKAFVVDMIKHLDVVKIEIADCKNDEDFVQQCQLVLKVSYGMDFSDFYEFLSYIANQRLKSKSLNYHNIFDLRQLRTTLKHFLAVEDTKELSFYGHARNLYARLVTIVTNHEKKMVK